MGKQICPKCKGNNSRNYEKCNCLKSGIPDKGCVVCKGSGKAPCYTCNGSGSIYVGSRP